MQVGEMGVESVLEGTWKGNDPVSSAFAIVDGDGSLAEIEVLDAKAHGFHEPKAAAIHDLGDEFPWGLERGETQTNCVAGHHHRRATATKCRGDVVEGEVLNAKDLFGEEGQSVKSSPLSGRGDVAFQSEEIEVGSDSGRSGKPGRLGEALEAEADKAAGFGRVTDSGF